MELKILNPSELQWDLNFFPLKPWPMLLPVLASKWETGYKVVAGFDRMTQPRMHTLILDRPPWMALNLLWKDEELRPLERLRFERKLGLELPGQYILSWPMEFQNFLDLRQIPIKNLRPLEYLEPWKNEISFTLLSSSYTSSQTRETIDLLCDLKLTGHTWEQVYSKENWLEHMKKLRFPKTYNADIVKTEGLQKIPWPRGVHAKWERQGDSAGISIQTKVSTPLEWDRLRDVLSRLEINKDLWDL